MRKSQPILVALLLASLCAGCAGALNGNPSKDAAAAADAGKVSERDQEAALATGRAMVAAEQAAAREKVIADMVALAQQEAGPRADDWREGG